MLWEKFVLQEGEIENLKSAFAKKRENTQLARESSTLHESNLKKSEEERQAAEQRARAT